MDQLYGRPKEGKMRRGKAKDTIDATIEDRGRKVYDLKMQENLRSRRSS